MSQGIFIEGTLLKVISVPESQGKNSSGETYVKPAHNKLQVLASIGDSLDLIDIKDSDFKYKKDSENKQIVIPIAITAMGSNIYYRVA
jgi:hypothetical protein